MQGLFRLQGLLVKSLCDGVRLVYPIVLHGKLSALIHAVPSAVIGGVFAVVCVIILLSGFRVIKNEEFSERELYIIGVPLIIAIGLLFMPAEIKESAPQFYNIY